MPFIVRFMAKLGAFSNEQHEVILRAKKTLKVFKMILKYAAYLKTFDQILK